MTLQGITPVKSVSYNTHAPVLANTESSIIDANGPVYDHPKENELVKVAISEGAGDLTKRLFNERELHRREGTTSLRMLTIAPSPLSHTVTSYQCGDRGDAYDWLWPSQGIDASDALQK